MLTIGSLCTGAAALDLAVGDVLGELHPAWVAEVDADASRVLSFRIGAPNLGDITAIARWETITGRPAPDPTVTGKRGGRRLSGRFVEWLMDWPDGWVTDLVDNTAALRICGNGVVRRQGATAVARLLEVA